MSEALAGMGELSAKGGMAFALGQAERAARLLRIYRRYRLTANLRVGPGVEARASALLTDLRNGRDLAQVEASSLEGGLYEKILNPSKIHAEDAVYRAIEVLAFKVWYSLSEGARPGLRPSSWITLARFVAGLDALASGTSSVVGGQDYDRAFRTFDSIVEEVDPNYLPARFFRGFAQLVRGEIEACASEMSLIAKRVEQGAGLYARALAAHWSETPPRWWLVHPALRIRSWLMKTGTLGRAAARHFDDLHAALGWWDDVLITGHGGTLYTVARTWVEHKEHLSKPDRANINLAFLEVRRETFDSRPDLRAEFDKITAFPDGGLTSASAARLDSLLNIPALENFDHQASLLEFNLEVSELSLAFENDLGSKESDNRTRDVYLARMKEDVLGQWYKPGLEAIESAIQKGNLNKARETLRRIRRQTKAPDQHSAAFMLTRAEPTLPGFSSMLISAALPVFRKVQQQRQILIDDQFYLESLYYRLLAGYQSLLLEKLAGFMNLETDPIFQRFFREDHLSPDSTDYEVSVLLQCLYCTAMVRLALMDKFDVLTPKNIHPVILSSDELDFPHIEMIKQRARTSFYLFHDHLRPRLTELRHSGMSRVKASATSLLAHLGRLEWVEQSEEKAYRGPKEDVANTLQLLQEALSYEPTAMRHIELAEFLASEGEKDEADRMLRLAQRSAPQHPVVRRWLRRT